MDVISIDASETVAETDGKQTCPKCGRRFSVTQSGAIRAHNCVDGPTSGKVRAKRGSKAKRSTEAPDTVTKLGRGLIATGVEYVTRGVVARAAECDPARVPANLPDDSAMIDPFIAMTWPSIPARAQSIITRVSQHEDIILACILWWEYIQSLQRFINEANQSKKDADNGVTRSLAPIALGTARPFQPLTPSDAPHVSNE